MQKQLPKLTRGKSSARYSKKAPTISSISPSQIDQYDQPVILRIQGRNLQQTTIVELIYDSEHSPKLQVKPSTVEPTELTVEIQPAWFEILAQTWRTTDKPYTFDTSPGTTMDIFWISVANDTGKSSQPKPVAFKRFRICAQMEVDQIPRANAGTELALDVTIERYNWNGKIPLKAIAFQASDFVDTTGPLIQTTQKIHGIESTTVIPASETHWRLPVKIARYVPEGSYLVLFAAPYSTIFSETLGNSNIAQALKDGYYAYIQTQRPCYPDCPPLPPNLQLTETTETTISLSIDDRSLDENGFEIQRRSPPGEWHTIHSEGPHTGRDRFTWIDTSLPPYTLYAYRVGAWNTNGTGYSEEVTAQTACPPPPAAPDNLRVLASSPTSITLGWRDNANDESSFWVQRVEAGNSEWRTIYSSGPHAGTGEMQYTDSGLNPDTGYYYHIRIYRTLSDTEYIENASNVIYYETQAPPTSVPEETLATRLRPGSGLTPDKPWQGLIVWEGKYPYIQAPSHSAHLTKLRVSRLDYDNEVRYVFRTIKDGKLISVQVPQDSIMTEQQMSDVFGSANPPLPILFHFTIGSETPAQIYEDRLAIELELVIDD